MSAYPIDDYREAFQALSDLAPDFIQAAMAYKFAPTTEEKRDYETKAAYIKTMSESIKILNSIAYNVENATGNRKPPRPVVIPNNNDYKL